MTEARHAVRRYRRRTGRTLGFTAWVVSCVARAAAEHPRVHSIRWGRRRLALFDEVDVSVLGEKDIEGGGEPDTLPMPFVVRDAARELEEVEVVAVDPDQVVLAVADGSRRLPQLLAAAISGTIGIDNDKPMLICSTVQIRYSGDACAVTWSAM